MNSLVLFIHHIANWWIEFVIGPIYEVLGFQAPSTSGGFGRFLAQSEAMNENNMCAAALVAGGLFFGVEVVMAIRLGHVGFVGGRRYAKVPVDFDRKNNPYGFWTLIGLYAALGAFSLFAGVQMFRGHLVFGS